MIISTAFQKELAWFDIDCQIQKAEIKARNAYKRMVIKKHVAKYIAGGMDPEIAKVLAKAEFDCNVIG